LGVGPTLGLFLFCHLNFSQHWKKFELNKKKVE
jgi:hypothetical protein